MWLLGRLLWPVMLAAWMGRHVLVGLATCACTKKPCSHHGSIPGWHSQKRWQLNHLQLCTHPPMHQPTHPSTYFAHHPLQDTERLQDLLNTLAILWASTAMPSPRPSSPTLGSGSGQRGLAVRRRPSVEGLTALHGELAQMQRQLQEVGQQGSRAASPLPEA